MPDAGFGRLALVLRSDDGRPNRDTYGFAGTGGVILEGQLLRPQAASDTVFVFMHPSSTLNLLPMTERLAARGHHVLCAYSRFVKNDTSLIMEKVVLDLGSWIHWARATAGYRRVVLVGWSGGGSLALLYQAQAEHPTITHTPAEDPVDLVGAGLSPADAVVLIAAHLSRAETLTEWLDPSVGDELNPDDRDPGLDIYAVAAIERPPFSVEFVARFRQAQRDRNRRITERVLGQLTALPERGESERAFVVHRTMCDVRWIDPTQDPNDRRPGWCYLGDPRTANNAAIGLGRFTTLRSWLSQWSLSHSAATSDRTAPTITGTPVLIVENTADDAAPASHMRHVHETLGTPDRTHLRVVGATHYYRDQPELLDEAIDTVLEWCRARDLVPARG